VKSTVSLGLQPLGRRLELARGARLQEVLFAEGVEFPCGGRGRCQGCRVRVLRGELPISEADQQMLTADALAAGWRLACQGGANTDLELELAQWETTILTDERHFPFEPSEGLGVAVDLGTTTIVGQLLDLRTGDVLGVATDLNAQAQHGADIMSRVDFAVGGQSSGGLTSVVRRQVGDLIGRLLQGRESVRPGLRRVLLVGNTVMHHLFGGLDVTPLAHAPFHSPRLGLLEFGSAELGWALGSEVRIRFLPCLGGFVGSDLLAGLWVTQLHREAECEALLDLGTNGEIVMGNRDGVVCAGTAAGPAFEGARISMGMRAATGAIARVEMAAGGMECEVIGGGPPSGICGSGLVDAVACGLDLGKVQPSGRLANGSSWEVAAPVALNQRDIRELQLAKGAIASGLYLLSGQLGTRLEEVTRIHLAGAFGNYINRASARRIGLLPVPLDRVTPAGNTALLGAKVLLFAPEGTDWEFAELRSLVHHVALHEDPDFQETYLQAMTFPSSEPRSQP